MEAALHHIAYYSVLLPAAVGILRWRRLSLRQWILVGFCLLAIVLQELGKVMQQYLGHNLPLYHLYVLMEGCCFLVPYWMEWKGQHWGRILLGAMVGFAVLALVSAIIYPGWNHFPVLSQTVGSVLLITVATAYWLRTLRELRYAGIAGIYLFWLNTAVFVYFTGNLLQSVYNEFIVTNARIFSAVWTIHHFFTIVFYILLAVGLLWKDPKTSSLRFSSSAP